MAANIFEHEFVSDIIDTYEPLTKPAFVDASGDEISFQRLVHQSYRLAEVIVSLGLDSKVAAIIQDKGIDSVVSIYGTLKAGFAFTAFDPKWPLERIQEALQKSNVSVILLNNATAELVPKLASTNLSILVFDEKNESIEIQNATSKVKRGLKSFTEARQAVRSRVIRNKNDTAYIICTSGTTGSAKAVMISHQSFTAFTKEISAILKIESDDRWLSVSPLYFDVCTVDLFVPAVKGATSYLLSKIMLPADLISAIRNNRITHTLLVSSLLRLLASKFSNLTNDVLSSLKLLWYGGEACPTSVLKKIKEHAPHLRFFHGYGPSEVCNTATYLEFSNIPIDSYEYMPIGKPLSTVDVYVIDEEGQVVLPDQVGKAGELLLGGIQVMKGYSGEPERTAMVLLPDFYKKSPYKLYRTGDRVVYDQFQNLVFKGRADDLIKTSGNLVSLLEIQKVLIRKLSVEDVIITSLPDELINNRIQAFILSDHTNLNRTTVIGHLNEALPRYMIPHEIYLVASSEVPRVPNGKIDIPALQEGARKGRFQLRNL